MRCPQDTVWGWGKPSGAGENQTLPCGAHSASHFSMRRKFETGALSGHLSERGVVSPWGGGAQLTGASGGCCWTPSLKADAATITRGWGGAAPWC